MAVDKGKTKQCLPEAYVRFDGESGGAVFHDGALGIARRPPGSTLDGKHDRLGGQCLHRQVSS